MTKNGLLALAGAIVLLAVGLTYASTHQRQRQPRIYVHAQASESSYSEWLTDFWAVCPHMALLRNDKAADYTIQAVWAPSRAKWVAWVERRDTARIYQGESPDSVSILRESCRNIRRDLDDWGNGNGYRPPSPSIGRYTFSYEPGSSNHTLLLDTKTGAVWELLNRKGVGGTIEFREFARISVDGLYTSFDDQLTQIEEMAQNPKSDFNKKVSQAIWDGERDREAAMDEQ